MRFLLAYDFARVFIVTHTQQSRMTKLVVFGPLNEADLDDDLRADPVSAYAREADGFGEGRLLDLDAIELGAQVVQEFRIKAGADLAGENEIIAVVVANQQGAQADALALRIGEAADYELLGQLTFHL